MGRLTMVSHQWDPVTFMCHVSWHHMPFHCVVPGLLSGNRLVSSHLSSLLPCETLKWEISQKAPNK